MTTNIFEYAARNKLRFQSVKGPLTAEQLWDVPLRSSDDFNLNTVAKAANKALEESGENFVDTTKTAEHKRREMVMETIKYVIQTKIDEEKAAEKWAANRKERQQLLDILADKQAGKLSELSEKQLQKRIAELEQE